MLTNTIQQLLKFDKIPNDWNFVKNDLATTLLGFRKSVPPTLVLTIESANIRESQQILKKFWKFHSLIPAGYAHFPIVHDFQVLFNFNLRC